jgi:hypothetical protein
MRLEAKNTTEEAGTIFFFRALETFFGVSVFIFWAEWEAAYDDRMSVASS